MQHLSKQLCRYGTAAEDANIVDKDWLALAQPRPVTLKRNFVPGKPPTVPPLLDMGLAGEETTNFSKIRDVVQLGQLIHRAETKYEQE